jgi:predicted nucleotidyltransferase
MYPTIESLRGMRPRITEIALRYGVSNVRVFGSVARGTAREGSDVDLLVEMDDSRSLLDLVGFEQEIEDELNTRVDVVVEGGIHPRLQPAILREAIAL